MINKITQKILLAILITVMTFSSWPFGIEKAQAANTKIRQEINIIDGYLGAAGGSYATSSAIVNLDSTKYTDATYYLEVVASTTSATDASVSLVDATTGTPAVSVTANGTSYARYRSDPFTPPGSATDYKVRLNDEMVFKGIISARIIILQNFPATIGTQTQIEIGSQELAKSNSATAALATPKYWYYNSGKWDGSPTFYAEVTYRNYQTSSSTIFTTATTSDTTRSVTTTLGTRYLVVEAWGAGGGGSIAAAGGGGGGGGAYAKTIFATTTRSTNTLFIPKGGVTDTAATAGSAKFNDTAGGTVATEVIAAGGTGTADDTAGAGGTVLASTGGLVYAGGGGGKGHTNSDVGGGGGGAAGPDGAGVTADGALGAAPSPGGAGNTGPLLGGAGGAAGSGDNDTCANAAGKPGINHVNGGGGGGGADGDGTGSCSGGPGAAPGGGGGSSEFASANQVGGAGQIKLTEIHGTVNFALQEDDGSFGSWSHKQMIVVEGTSTSTPARVRVSFTPSTGRNYRIVASTTNSGATYDIYNAKIIVDQTSPTKLEPQYLLANSIVSSEAALPQSFITSWDPAEWTSGYSYYHEASAADNSTSVLEINEVPGGSQVANSSISSPDNRGRSARMSMPAAAGNIDVKVPTNNVDVYSSRIIVQVSPAVSEGTASPTRSFMNFFGGRIKFLGGRVLFK